VLSVTLAATAAAQERVAPPASSPLPPLVGLVQLEFTNDARQLTARVLGPEPRFFGAVLLSLSPMTMQYLVDLPPILLDFAVMGVGQAKDHELQFAVPHGPWPQEFKLYGQALAIDESGLSASGIVRVGEL
jgi:hypothetical protein